MRWNLDNYSTGDQIVKLEMNTEKIEKREYFRKKN